MIDPAHIPVLLVQAQTLEGVQATSEGLSKGGVYFICAVLAAICLGLYRELSAERAAHRVTIIEGGKSERALIEKHNTEMLGLVKENMPLAYKLAEGVQEIGRLANTLTRD